MTMLSLLRAHRLLAGLAASACMLWIGAALVMLSWGEPDPVASATPIASASFDRSSDFESVISGSAPDTPKWHEKPLFEPERRIARAETEPQATPEPQTAPDLMLTGVMIDGQRRLAVLQDQTNRESAVLAPGQRFKGWRLTEVSAERVNLALGPRTIQLDLFSDDGRARVGHHTPAPAAEVQPGTESTEATDEPPQASF